MDTCIENIAQLSKQNNDPNWLSSLRIEAYKQFESLALPTLQKTNIHNWAFDNFDYNTEDKLSDDMSKFSLFIDGTNNRNCLVQKNDKPIMNHLEPELREKGVIFTHLSAAIAQHEALVRKYWAHSGERYSEHRLTAQNRCMTSNGLFLYVPANVEADLPLQALFCVEGERAAIFPHILIVAETNSKLNLTITFESDDDSKPALCNSMLTAYIGENAQASIATVNNLPASAIDIIYRRANLNRDGRLEWLINDLSEGKVISDTTTHLEGDGSTVSIQSTALGINEAKTNITYEMHHWGKRTASDINARSVLKDKATNILNSITKIEKGASKSDGQQSSKVLILNQTARGDANPILLIDENDVTAGHAASVGKVDPLQLYYLMSRGIPRVKAEKLLVYGFLESVISEITAPALRELIYKVLDRKLN